MKIDGKLVEIDAVSKRASEEALSLYNDMGYKGSTFIPGSNEDNMYFYLETMLDKYEEGLALLKDYIFNVEFNEERTKNLVDQLLNGIPSAKLKATTVVSSAYDALYFSPEANVHHMNFFRQEKFLKGVQQELETNATVVLKKLFDLASQVKSQINMLFRCVHLTSIFHRLPGPRTSTSTWPRPTRGCAKSTARSPPTPGSSSSRSPRRRARSSPTPPSTSSASAGTPTPTGPWPTPSPRRSTSSPVQYSFLDPAGAKTNL